MTDYQLNGLRMPKKPDLRQHGSQVLQVSQGLQVVHTGTVWTCTTRGAQTGPQRLHQASAPVALAATMETNATAVNRFFIFYISLMLI